MVPVLKPKGKVTCKDDYRGIAVGSALSKLYSLILLRRLDKWAEDNGMRAKGQAGFRHLRGTGDNAFILQHLIEKYSSLKRPVYTAFIDFKKAYDSVDRELLWKCLESMGVHGRFLESLKEMYCQVKMAVRVGGEVGETFMADLGVKQGDPLSPLLFGLFIDRIERFFQTLLPSAGVRLATNIVQVLLYADDLVLMAERPEDLQAMLDTLQKFCVGNALTVNVKKSEAVIFNSKFASESQYTFTYDGKALVTQNDFVYLGMLFDRDKGVRPSLDRNIDKGRKAYFAMLRRFYEMGICNIDLKCHMFDSLVKPVLNYGCEVWGPYHLKGESMGKVEVIHMAFLKSILSVRKSTPTLPIMTELCREPMGFSRIKQILGFYNSVLLREDDDLVKIAMAENCHMAAHDLKSKCWVAQLALHLRRNNLNDDASSVTAFAPICIMEIMTTLRSKWLNSQSTNMNKITSNNNHPTMSLVRNVPDGGIRGMEGFKTFTYSRWFAPMSEHKHTRFWRHLNNSDQIKAVAQFRLGAHWLNIETSRFSRPPVPRSRRLCNCCHLDDREDELHVLLCPLFLDARSSFHALFGDVNESLIPLNMDFRNVTDESVRSFMNPPHQGLSDLPSIAKFWIAFAKYLLYTKRRRALHLLSLANSNIEVDHNLPSDID